jgi:predicted TIM-barrel fold metal-dependent hydrolase
MAKKSLLILLAIAVVAVGYLAVRDLRPHSQTVGEYLQDLFITNGITVSEDDFLEPVDDPYLALAKILNLVSTTSQSDDRMNERMTRLISRQFLAVKDELYLDGLYGKIDMHEHYRVGGDIGLFLEAAACYGISKVLFVPTDYGPDNKNYKMHWTFLIALAKLYPDQVIPFCTIDEADPHAAELVEQYILEGAKGIKLIGGHPSFYDEPLNSENMYKVYDKAAQYGVPILVHASIINIPELKDQLDQVYGDFPDVTFIQAHYGSTIMAGIDLDQMAELLDKHPNLYTDLSMGGGIARYQYYLQQDLETIRDFVIEYQDRILFGSDIILRPARNHFDWLYERIACDIYLHEKAEYTCEFGHADWVHQGFNLDKEILRKLYYENPKKVLGL